MRTTLEDLYYGNITPCEQQMIPGSELKRAVDRVAKCEAQLMELLNEEGQQALTRFNTAAGLFYILDAPPTERLELLIGNLHPRRQHIHHHVLPGITGGESPEKHSFGG